MKQAIIFFLLLAALIVSGCGKPVVDASTDESMKASLEQVRSSVPEDRRAEFDTSLQVLALADITLENIMSQRAAGGVDTVTPKLKDRLNGKTAEEIIAAGNAVKEEREKKKREQALQEIQELMAKANLAQEAREQLAAFDVKRSRFFKEKSSFGMSDPVIELTVENKTEHAISRAYFRGTVASPGRSVPWIHEDFRHSIRGGLEPGESATWKLAPNSFSAWGTVDVPADAVFTVEVVKLDGSDGETLFDAEGLSEFKQERLEKLKKEYGVE